MTLPLVSRTAILTLIARIAASQKDSAILDDPMAALCLDGLLPLVSEEDRRWILREKRVFSGTQFHHAKAGARRARIFDAAANRFIAGNPRCTVVNLGCGFDTRFWRIARQDCRYIEIDLPEVVALKVDRLMQMKDYAEYGVG
jgi:O-methyltransferase involved in polyketide biosynthesis